VPNHYDPRFRAKLTDGLVITIEPIIAAGSGRAELQPDKWTIRTGDGSLAAHYEHDVIVITKDEPILLTAARYSRQFYSSASWGRPSRAASKTRRPRFAYSLRRQAVSSKPVKQSQWSCCSAPTAAALTR
jgi:hypothetical protein